jgi:hypothetical protein
MATIISGDTGVDKVVDGSIAAVDLATNAVTTAKVLDANVTIAKLSATGTPSATTFLRGDNAWAAAGSGTPTLLTTLNTTSGTELTTATLDLTTYNTIYVKLNNIGQSTDTGSHLQWKNNGGTYIDLFGSMSSTTESGMGYVICRPKEFVPNYYYWQSPYGARGRDWNVAVVGGPVYKFLTTTMIVPTTTSISFQWAGGQTFDLGQVLIYGQT